MKKVPRFVNRDPEHPNRVYVDHYIGPSSSVGLNLSEDEVSFLRSLPEDKTSIIMSILQKCAEARLGLGKYSK